MPSILPDLEAPPRKIDMHAARLPSLQMHFGKADKREFRDAAIDLNDFAAGPFRHIAFVGLPLKVNRNTEHFGMPDGAAMEFSFAELVVHAAKTRNLCAGTIIGSGTVSNDDAMTVGSCCIAERRALKLLNEGAPRTPYLRFDERVRMECLMPDGTSLFGFIDQKVVSSRKR